MLDDAALDARRDRVKQLRVAAAGFSASTVQENRDRGAQYRALAARMETADDWWDVMKWMTTILPEIEATVTEATEKAAADELMIAEAKRHETEPGRASLTARSRALEAAIVAAIAGREISKSIQSAGVIRPAVLAHLGMNVATPKADWPTAATIKSHLPK